MSRNAGLAVATSAPLLAAERRSQVGWRLVSGLAIVRLHRSRSHSPFPGRNAYRLCFPRLGRRVGEARPLSVVFRIDRRALLGSEPVFRRRRCRRLASSGATGQGSRSASSVGLRRCADDQGRAEQRKRLRVAPQDPGGTGEVPPEHRWVLTDDEAGALDRGEDFRGGVGGVERTARGDSVSPGVVDQADRA
jgi:hypothetical protein